MTYEFILTGVFIACKTKGLRTPVCHLLSDFDLVHKLMPLHGLKEGTLSGPRARSSKGFSPLKLARKAKESLTDFISANSSPKI